MREENKTKEGFRMSQQYEFCPRCGALMRDGVCQSCEFTVNVNPQQTQNVQGYTNPQQAPNYGQGYTNPQVQTNYNQGYGTYQNNATNMGVPPMQQPKKNKTGLIVGLIAGGILLFVVIIIVAVIGIFFALTAGKTDDTDDSINEYEYEFNYDDEYDYSDDDSDYENNEDDYTWEEEDDGLIDLDGDGIGDLEYESGIEGLNAEYYPVITDYIRYDLSYSVTFLEYSDDEGNVECFYPYLKGDQDFIPYFNQAFYMIAEGVEELADEYNCQASSVAYVTYMDEEIFSVVFIEMYTFEDGTNYEDILCYSFNMETGDLLDFALNDTSDDFLDELESRCMEESTTDATYLFTEYSNDELRDIITNEEYSLVAFYTPLGMEIGITYEGYWCCATFKDYEDYISIVEEETTEF